MRKIILLTALLASTAAITGARAESLGRPCTDKAESAYLPMDQLKAKIVAQGYEIRSGEVRKACGEFYVIDKKGNKAELFVDPTNGTIVSGGDGKRAEAEDEDDK